MAKKKSRSSRGSITSPINPSIHFVLFLILALFLVIIVAGIMQRTSQNIRASLICPQVNLAQQAQEVKLGCPDSKIRLGVDDNRCPVWECAITAAPGQYQLRPALPSTRPR